MHRIIEVHCKRLRRAIQQSINAMPFTKSKASRLNNGKEPANRLSDVNAIEMYACRQCQNPTGQQVEDNQKQQ